MFHATIFNNTALVVSSKVVENVLHLVENTGLYNLSPEELLGLLRSYSGGDGLCTRERFRALFSDDETLLEIFDAFDRTDSGSCDVTELAIGLCVFCQGSKSTKLAFAFDLLDEDKDELLTRRGIWRFIMSFLCVLLKMGQYFDQRGSKKDVTRLLDGIAVGTASEILSAVKEQRVSFSNIADWYSQRGCIDSSWIELLDLKKWIPVVQTDSDSSDDDDEGVYYHQQQQKQQQGDAEEEDEDDVEDDEDAVVVYTASLLGRHNLIIRASDTMRVFAISHASGMDGIEASELVSLLNEYEGPNGCIQASAFQHFVQNFIPLETLTATVRNGLVKTLFQIFRVFEEHSNFDEGADIRSLSIGLSLFCSGNKSNKLGTGFHVFDIHRAGHLSKSFLSSFLSSILLLLTALGSIEHSSIAFGTAQYVTDEICRGTGSDLTSFAAFGDWYNSEGFRISSWIELLNLEKWTTFTPGLEYSPAGAYDEDEDDEDDDDDDDDDDDEEDDDDDDGDADDIDAEEDDDADGAFSISLHGPIFEKVLDVSKACALEVLEYKRTFSSSQSAQSSSFQRFIISLVESSRDGIISKAAYEQVLRKSGFDVRASLHGSGSFLLTLFDAYDRSLSGFADIVELLTGITVLFDGNKSSKLMFAFDLFDDSKSGLSRSEMWRFFRSFLTTILLLTALQPSDKFQILVDEAAEWCVDDMISSIHARDADEAPPETLTFDMLSYYYGDTGYLGCAWLELLDLEKWMMLVVD